MFVVFILYFDVIVFTYCPVEICCSFIVIIIIIIIIIIVIITRDFDLWKK